MRHLFLVLLLIITGISYGQKFAYPVIKTKGQHVTDFVPAGWVIHDSVSGDLNGDNRNDVTIVLQHKDSIPLPNDLGDTVLTQPRILLILFKNAPDDQFTQAAQSNSFVLKHDNTAMDDPYLEMAINKGVLEIKFHLFFNIGTYYVTNAVYKFRYRQGDFTLIGADLSSFHRATHDFADYSYNFLTKKRASTKGNDEKGTKKITRSTVRISTLKTLTTFREPFTWGIEKDIFL